MSTIDVVLSCLPTNAISPEVQGTDRLQIGVDGVILVRNGLFDPDCKLVELAICAMNCGKLQVVVLFSIRCIRPRVPDGHVAVGRICADLIKVVVQSGYRIAQEKPTAVKAG